MCTVYELKSPKCKQYFIKLFFYKHVLDFHRPSNILCQTSGRQNHWTLAITQIIPDVVRALADPCHLSGEDREREDKAAIPPLPPLPPRHLRISDKSIGEGILTICVGNSTIHSLGEDVFTSEPESVNV